MAERATSIYARQLQGEATALKFDEPLEREFRRQYAVRNLAFLRIGAIQGAVFVGLSALLDWRLAAGNAATIAIKLGLMAPMLLALLVALNTSALVRHARRVALATAIALMAGSTSLLLAASPAAMGSTVLGIHVATIFVYLMLGLRLYPALCCALPMTALLIWIEGRIGVDAAVAAFDCVFLLFTNVIGALTCYRLEHAARTSFLEREIVNILSGNDSATGIPSRRAFNRHLQTAQRQADRDGKGIAVLIARVDEFGALRARYGNREAEQALRRIAHAIVRSLKRPLDLAARFAESEFAVLLYDPAPSHLQAIMREMRERVAVLGIEHDGANRAGLASVSIGAALSRDPPHDAHKLLVVADEALAEASAPDSHGIAVKGVSPRSAARSVRPGPWVAGTEDPAGAPRDRAAED